MNSINLIPRHVRDAAAIRRRLLVWAVVLVAGGMGLGITAVGIRTVGGKELNRLASDGGRLSDRIARAEAQLDAIHQKVVEASIKVEASETVGVHPDWSLLLRALAALRGDDVVLRGIQVVTIDPPRAAPPAKASAGKARPKAAADRREVYSVVLEGCSLSQGGVLDFAARLEALGIMQGVQLKSTRADTHLGVPAVAFEFVCGLSDAAPRNAAAAAADTEDQP